MMMMITAMTTTDDNVDDWLIDLLSDWPGFLIDWLNDLASNSLAYLLILLVNLILD